MININSIRWDFPRQPYSAAPLIDEDSMNVHTPASRWEFLRNVAMRILADFAHAVV